MMSCERKTLSFHHGRPVQYIFAGTVVLDKIHIYRCERFNSVSKIPCSGQGLEKYLRQQYSRTEVDINAAFKIGSNRGKKPEIPEAPFAKARSISLGVHMNDIR